jgi:uncharacterized coiled-coil protein SlyX
MSFSPEQIEEVNGLFRRFAALEESLPTQLERITESLSAIEARFDQFQVSSHEQLVQETSNVMVQAQDAVNSLRAELHHFVSRFHEHLGAETPHPAVQHRESKANGFPKSTRWSTDLPLRMNVFLIFAVAQRIIR